MSVPRRPQCTHGCGEPSASRPNQPGAERDDVAGSETHPDHGGEFDFTVAFETRARNDVEDTVSPVAVLRRITPALDLHDINVFGVELRADVGSDVGVWNGHAVDQPGHLMTAANVQLVVNHIGARR